VEVSSARFFLSSRFLLRCFLVFNRELLDKIRMMLDSRCWMW
jgi:hypothetical protein